MSTFFRPFRILKEKVFAKLYFAQTISLLGDAFTWVGIALLAFEFGGDNSARILATALTLRVTAFIIFGPYAGVLADRIDRKKILYITHLLRMIVVGLFPFVTQIWQIYALIFILNIFNSFFTPAYKASIPQTISKKENFADAISLSNATWELLGILGPGLAGALAVVMGARAIFFFDAASFIIAAILIFSISGTLLVNQKTTDTIEKVNNWKDIFRGTKLLFKNLPIRFALFIELVAAIAGAHILVNTIGLIKSGLNLTDNYYGYIMTAFGIGATIAAFTANNIDKTKNKIVLLISGAALLAIAISLGNYMPFGILIILWLLAGIGQSFTELPSQILIAENIELHEQGKVYGAHFAWSHLWWAIAYPISGLTGTQYRSTDFLIGGCLTFLLLLLLCLYYYIKKKSLVKN